MSDVPIDLSENWTKYLTSVHSVVTKQIGELIEVRGTSYEHLEKIRVEVFKIAGSLTEVEAAEAAIADAESDVTSATLTLLNLEFVFFSARVTEANYEAKMEASK
jgi:hypothetical protein